MYPDTQADLVTEMDRLIHPPDDPIENVEIRISNLEGANLSKSIELYVYHARVILETANCFYSIEKGLQGVDLKQSQKYETLAMTSKTRRSGKITKAREITMNQLIDHLHAKNLVKHKYNKAMSNCKTFASDVFNFVQNGENNVVLNYDSD